jgi:FAD/FMN-containing dehydrogenase
MEVTVGGAVAMNVHGKNQYAKGSIGEYVEALSVIRSDGRLVRLDRKTAPREVRQVIGAQGLTGFISDVSLAMSRVHSGYLEVESWSAGSMRESLALLESKAGDSDYSVGWVDCFPDAARAGRGILHFARQLAADHPRAGQAMRPLDQRLPPRVAGLLPREWAWRVLRWLTHDPGMRLLNLGRSLSGRVRHGHRYYQTHAAFHFLLDYVPGWKRAYGRPGLIQYQLFVPSADAPAVFEEALRLQRRLGVISYLAVLKRHRADDYPASYSVDGFSLAMDFPVRLQSLAALRDLCRSFDALLRETGGSIYAAKDAVGVGRLPDGRDPLFATNLTRRWERRGTRGDA